MSAFTYYNNQLCVEGLPIAALATQYGTPLYVYAYSALEAAYTQYYQALKTVPHQICYAVKANSNLAILNAFATMGSGFDIVSGGELERVLAAGGSAAKTVFSGVGKQLHEMTLALTAGINCFNVESAAELIRLNEAAAGLNVKAPIALRVNPDVDAGTHPYISTGLKENKFGIEIEEALALYQFAAAQPHLQIKGIAYHIGSQLIEAQPFIDALDRVLLLIEQLKQHGIELQQIDIGGGLGIDYRNEQPPAPADYLMPLLKKIAAHQLRIVVEPGRSLVGNAGVLVTKVDYLKATAHKKFAIVDAAMNDLIRPALYDAWHDIVSVIEREDAPAANYDIVGPVCETGDFLGKDRTLKIQERDLLAIKCAGAYGFTMSSNYNSRPRAAEILVKKGRAYLIRARETTKDLFALESIVP